MILNLEQLARRVPELTAQLHLQHHETEPAPRWWGRRVDLFGNLLAVLDSILADTELDALHREAARHAHGYVRQRLAVADQHYHGVMHDHRLLGEAPDRPFSLYHSCPRDPSEDQLCGAFPTLADALAATGHEDLADWERNSKGLDVLVLSPTAYDWRPDGSPWMVVSPGIAGHFVDQLTASVTAPPADDPR